LGSKFEPSNLNLLSALNAGEIHHFWMDTKQLPSTSPPQQNAGGMLTLFSMPPA
jgi:hypothetical protein